MRERESERAREVLGPTLRMCFVGCRLPFAVLVFVEVLVALEGMVVAVLFGD